LKNYLAKELLVSAPEPYALLLLYVAASDHAVSSALIQEKQIGPKVVQTSVYYISEALVGAKLNYSELEKNCICSPDLLQEVEALLPSP
jgi:hypothetical protein